MKKLIIKANYENDYIESDLLSITVADDISASTVCDWMVDAKENTEGFMAEDILDYLVDKGQIHEWHYIEEDDSVIL